MKKSVVVVVLVLAGCQAERQTTPCGTELYSPLSGPILQAYNREAIAACAEAQAVEAGGFVTRCYDTANGTTCVTQ